MGSVGTSEQHRLDFHMFRGLFETDEAYYDNKGTVVVNGYSPEDWEGIDDKEVFWRSMLTDDKGTFAVDGETFEVPVNRYHVVSPIYFSNDGYFDYVGIPHCSCNKINSLYESYVDTYNDFYDLNGPVESYTYKTISEDGIAKFNERFNFKFGGHAEYTEETVYTNLKISAENKDIYSPKKETLSIPLKVTKVQWSLSNGRNGVYYKDLKIINNI